MILYWRQVEFLIKRHIHFSGLAHLSRRATVLAMDARKMLFVIYFKSLKTNAIYTDKGKCTFFAPSDATENKQ